MANGTPRTTVAKPVRPSRKPRASRPATRKAATKTGVKSAARKKPAARLPVRPAQVKATKPAKAKKPKLVRDSFTIPKAEYGALDDLKLRAIKLARHVKKSELLRAGIKALTGMSDKEFLDALTSVPAIKTGRPKKN